VSYDKEEALRYHAMGRPGKIKVVPTKPTVTAEDLSLAYSPGVADPCLEIARQPEEAYRYTAKGNLVAVISNGSAVLGLGNIGALAGKPVMEGKGVLFKRFADIDVFDIEINSSDPGEIIRTCELISPTFGGMNLEDIRAPECFEIEQELKQRLDIPVGADVFVGLSQKGLVSPQMIRDMSDRPVIFAMANPDPEITPDEVAQIRGDAIVATGRSDYPNQVNNVLGFPFIFRGALDVRAASINEEMKRAAVQALAELAQRGEALPEVVKNAYPGENFEFGPRYIIPKPFDPRVLVFVASAVAQAAMDSKVARAGVDITAYERRLNERISEISSL